MLGYSVTVSQIHGEIREVDFARVHEIPYPDSVDSIKGFMREPGVHVSSRTRIDAILDCVESGAARLVHDGGYPYLIYARGGDIVTAFARELGDTATELEENEWYMVEAWDQS
ncbi:hypothetical protein DC31_17170 [Microbacterium sp. CH12i]|uniref:hypothetical protein n=1 Tax=Microbacterium sp. CH12i TaxID=1479651 RepID=UPI000461E9AA|nr:hypothetical protein [Microbacterium sp. CH12i]KDA05290.1 hypothetical protein DC31_17170 [Microbacterium sp. CH12i]